MYFYVLQKFFYLLSDWTFCYKMTKTNCILGRLLVIINHLSFYCIIKLLASLYEDRLMREFSKNDKDRV